MPNESDTERSIEQALGRHHKFQIHPNTEVGPLAQANVPDLSHIVPWFVVQLDNSWWWMRSASRPGSPRQGFELTCLCCRYPTIMKHLGTNYPDLGANSCSWWFISGTWKLSDDYQIISNADVWKLQVVFFSLLKVIRCSYHPNFSDWPSTEISRLELTSW